MLRLKPNCLSNTKTGAVNCLEQNSMLEIGNTGKETRNFLHAEDSWQFSASGTGWQTKTVINFTIADMPVKVGDTGQVILA
jgi:hypothetical protein